MENVPREVYQGLMKLLLGKDVLAGLQGKNIGLKKTKGEK
jgi:hypothetical protein